MKPKVLLVDDDTTQVQIRQAVLRKAGFDVEIVNTASDALELVRERTAAGQLGLVITDHLMPRSSGAELVREIRALNPQVPVMVVTGLSEAEPEYEGLDVTFRQKPLSPDELIALVDKALKTKGRDTA
jgi:DNA-binding response OmpR family regulator